jgi:radical SAM superfamily enzyme YgiQ (UPF0313 family)
MKFPWYPRGGIRVDRINPELLSDMRDAGCYRVPFGIESGSQKVLDRIQKGTSIEQAEKAVRMAQAAGLETECYFMIGLPGETEKDMEMSLNFAIRLNPDYMKFAVTIPLPGTPMFDEMCANNQIKTFDWDKYTFSTPASEIYDHDTLSWDRLDAFSSYAHRRFYFRVRYIIRAVYRSLLNGSFLGHLYALFKTKW